MLMMLVSVALATVPPLGLRAELRRPALSGPTQQVDAGDFRIHFTTEGVDATDTTDVDDNGVPDVVDEVVRGLALGREVFAAEGWPAPLPDDGTDGGPALDVYLQALPVNGYAFPIPTEGGSTCFMAIDPNVTAAGDILASVAVHELHHCIQFGYQTGLPSWLYESASTFEQFSHLESPLLDLALGALYANELGSPDTRLASEAGDNDPYTSFLFMKLWTDWQTDGEPALDRLPRLWARLAEAERWRPALDDAARDTFDVPLEVVFLVYALWNSFACEADDGGHYAEAPLPCTAQVSVPIEPIALDDPAFIRHEEGPFTAHYLELTAEADGDYALRCQGEDVLTAWVAVENGARRQVALGLASDDQPQVRLAAGDVGRAVIVGTEGRLQAQCRATRLVPEPTGCATAPGAGASLALLLLLGVRRRRSTRA